MFNLTMTTVAVLMLFAFLAYDYYVRKQVKEKEENLRKRTELLISTLEENIDLKNQLDYSTKLEREKVRSLREDKSM